MKPLCIVGLVILLTVLSGHSTLGGGKREAADWFSVGTNSPPSYTLQISPPKGTPGSGVTFHIRESNSFLPQRVVVSATNQIPGGYLVQVSGRGTEEMLDLSGIIIVANHSGYFGDGKRIGSSVTISLLLDNRDKAEAVASMIRTRYSLPFTAPVTSPVETPSDQHTNQIDH